MVVQSTFILMALSDNPFVGLPTVDLIDLQTKYVQVIKDVATTGQSYTFPGRSFTRADLPELRTTLSEIRIALAIANGTGGRSTAQAVIDTQSKF